MTGKNNMNIPKEKSSNPADFDFVADIHDEHNFLAGLENYEPERFSLSLYPEYDFNKKLGITDNIYLFIGLDIRFLKKLNPKGKIIF